jgi:hypothetical protein
MTVAVAVAITLEVSGPKPPRKCSRMVPAAVTTKAKVPTTLNAARSRSSRRNLVSDDQSDKANYAEAGAFMNQIAEPGIQRAHASHQAECSRARPLAAGQTARPVIQAAGSVGAARDLGNDERRKSPRPGSRD